MSELRLTLPALDPEIYAYRYADYDLETYDAKVNDHVGREESFSSHFFDSAFGAAACLSLGAVYMLSVSAFIGSWPVFAFADTLF